MPSAPRIYFVSSLLFLTLVIVLTAPSTFGYIQAESPPIVEHASGNSSAAHSALPQDQSLTPLAFVMVTFQGVTLGEIVYDDAKTERLGDFAAMFSTAGHLLGVTWVDQFGIQRTAVDRGLLEEANELEGVFVVLLEGDAL